MPVDEALGGVGLEYGETVPCNLCIFVHRRFGRQFTAALAETAVVDRQHREAEGVQLFDAKQLPGEVPARAMEVQCRGRSRLDRGPPPGVDLLWLAIGA